VTDYAERIVRLGADERVVGIATLPATPRANAPAFLLMNAGVVHRIGPHRINVKLARLLAREGFASLRIDLSGLGDSPASNEPQHGGQQALRDLRLGMAYLEQTQGIRKFVVFGICSGAVNGYRLALDDDRVSGLVMLDGYMFATWKTHLRRRLARLRALPLRALVRKPLEWLRPEPPPDDLGEDENDAHLGHPTRAQFRDAMDTLVRRGTQVYLVFTGSFLEYYNYDSQLGDTFGRSYFYERVRHQYMPDVDHTVTTLAAQHKVLQALRDWVHSLRLSPEAGAATMRTPVPSLSGRSGSSIQESISPP
jgi:hypothetical protein